MKIKIIFIIPSLRAGGAERIVSYIAENLSKELFTCTLIVIGFEKDKVYDIENTQIVYLNKKKVSHSFISLFKFVSKNKPDIIFSAISHLNIMMGIQAIFFSKIKYIGREANVKSVLKNYSTNSKKRNLVRLLISKIGYKFLDKIVCQSNDMANDLMTNYNFPDSKIIIINNPISKKLKQKSEIKNIKSDSYKLITVGRLVPQKGHLRILDALEKLHLPFKYTIIGDGPEKAKIEDYSKKLNIYNNIIFIPYTNKVFEYLAENHLFLQGSYVEGFPNALLESCAVGTPAVAFRAPGGIDEIIDDGVNGYIANNVDEYTERIVDILNTLVQWNPSVVSKSVFIKYSSNEILRKYEGLFINIIKK